MSLHSCKGTTKGPPHSNPQLIERNQRDDGGKLFPEVADMTAKSTSHKLQFGKFRLDSGKNFFTRRWCNTFRHRRNRTSILAGFQDSTKQNHGLPTVAGRFASGGRLHKMACRGPFQSTRLWENRIFTSV